MVGSFDFEKRVLRARRRLPYMAGSLVPVQSAEGLSRHETLPGLRTRGFCGQSSRAREALVRASISPKPPSGRGAGAMMLSFFSSRAAEDAAQGFRELRVASQVLN